MHMYVYLLWTKRMWHVYNCMHVHNYCDIYRDLFILATCNVNYAYCAMLNCIFTQYAEYLCLSLRSSISTAWIENVWLELKYMSQKR